jgi:hypothetical protein
MSNLQKLRTAFEAATKEGYIDLSTVWSLRNNNVMCGNTFVAEVLVDCDSGAMNDERLANAEFIILAHNMMPEILVDLDRLQLLESELDCVKDRKNRLEIALKVSTEAMDQMREQIEQMRGIFDDMDGAIQAACDAHDTAEILVSTLLTDISREVKMTHESNVNLVIESHFYEAVNLLSDYGLQALDFLARTLPKTSDQAHFGARADKIRTFLKNTTSMMALSDY